MKNHKKKIKIVSYWELIYIYIYVLILLDSNFSLTFNLQLHIILFYLSRICRFKRDCETILFQFLKFTINLKENDILTPYFDSTLDSLTWHAQVEFIFEIKNNFFEAFYLRRDRFWRVGLGVNIERVRSTFWRVGLGVKIERVEN